MMNVVGMSLYLAMVSVLNISLAILKTSNSRSTRMKKNRITATSRQMHWRL